MVKYASKDRNGNLSEVPVIPTGDNRIELIHKATVNNRSKYAVTDTKYIVNSSTAYTFMTKHFYFFRSKSRIETLFHKALVEQSKVDEPQSTEIETVTSAGVVGQLAENDNTLHQKHESLASIVGQMAECQNSF